MLNRAKVLQEVAEEAYCAKFYRGLMQSIFIQTTPVAEAGCIHRRSKKWVGMVPSMWCGKVISIRQKV